MVTKAKATFPRSFKMRSFRNKDNLFVNKHDVMIPAVDVYCYLDVLSKERRIFFVIQALKLGRTI